MLTMFCQVVSSVNMSRRPTQARYPRKHQNIAVRSRYACSGDRSWNTLNRIAASSLMVLCDNTRSDKYDVRANHCAFSAWKFGKWTLDVTSLRKAVLSASGLYVGHLVKLRTCSAGVTEFGALAPASTQGFSTPIYQFSWQDTICLTRNRALHGSVTTRAIFDGGMPLRAL
jgi:hypothetical protein